MRKGVIADPVPDVAGGHTSPSALSRSFRRSFFSPTHQADEPRMRIAKDPVDGLIGTKLGKPIYIRQTTDFACFRHSYIMPKNRTSVLRILCR